MASPAHCVTFDSGATCITVPPVHPSVTPPAPHVVPHASAAGALAFTGADIAALVILAVILAGCGVLLVMLSNYRRKLRA